MPAPEDVVGLVNGGDEGIAGDEGFRGLEEDVTIGGFNTGDEGAHLGSCSRIHGFPHNLGTGNGPHGFSGITLHSLELVHAGVTNHIAVGAGFAAQIGNGLAGLITRVLTGIRDGGDNGALIHHNAAHGSGFLLEVVGIVITALVFTDNLVAVTGIGIGRGAVEDGTLAFITHAGAAGIPAGHREHDVTVGKVLGIKVEGPAVVAVNPQSGGGVIGRHFVSGRAGVEDGLFAAFGLPQVCQVFLIPVTGAVAFAHIDEHGRIGNGISRRFRTGFFGDFCRCFGKTGQRVVAAPLIVHTIGLTAHVCRGSRIQGTQVTVHHRKAVESLVRDDVDGRLGNPDEPVPQNGISGILGHDNSTAGHQFVRSGEVDDTVLDGHLGNNAALGRSRFGSLGFPQYFHLGHGTHALFTVTLHGLEHVFAGSGDDVGIGALLLAKVGGSNGFGVLGQLADGDGLQHVFGALANDVHGADTALFRGVVLQLEGDGVHLGFHGGNADPFILGNYVKVYVGKHMGFHGGSFGFGNIVDGKQAFLESGLIQHLNAFGLNNHIHDGSQAHLGVGIEENHAAGFVGIGRYDNLFFANLHIEGLGVITGTHNGLGGLGGDGVRDFDGSHLGEEVLRLVNLQLKGLGEGNVHRGAVGQGEDHLVFQHLDVGENAVLEGGAFVLHLAQLGLLAVNLYPEHAFVVDGELRGLIHRHFLAVNLDGNPIHGPNQFAGTVADDGEHRTLGGIGGNNLEPLHIAVGVGDGNTGDAAAVRVGIFLDLGHKHAVAHSALNALD